MSKLFPSPLESVPQNGYHCPICFYYRIDYSLDVMVKWYKRKTAQSTIEVITVRCKAADFCSDFGDNFLSTNV